MNRLLWIVSLVGICAWAWSVALVPRLEPRGSGGFALNVVSLISCMGLLALNVISLPLALFQLSRFQRPRPIPLLLAYAASCGLLLHAILSLQSR